MMSNEETFSPDGSRLESLSTVDNDTSEGSIVSVVLEEYKALRVELMFYVDNQRKYQQLILTVAVGQAGALLSNFHVNQYALGVATLFLVPFAIMTLMFLQLEVTSKILLVADYIHKGIKPQLINLLGNTHKFFEWEEHKSQTSRVSRKLLLFLDSTRWFVFIYGLVASLIIGGWLILKSRDSGFSTMDYLLLVSGSAINLFFIMVAAYASVSFNEVEGETKHLLIRPKNSGHLTD